MAEARRTLENESMDAYTTAKAVSDLSARRAEQASSVRGMENASMQDWSDYKAEVARRGAAESMTQAGILNVGGKFGMTDSFLNAVVDRMIGVESANNPRAKNPNSSATGLGQFTSGTWMGMFDRVNPTLAHLSRQEKLDLRNDPTISRAMTAQYTIDNAANLQKNGIAVTPESLYASHFLGPQGAVAAYNANPDDRAIDVLGAAAVSANSSIMRGKSIGSVLGYVDRKMAGTLDKASTSTTQVAATTPTQSPAEIEAAARQRATEAAVEQGQDPSSPTTMASIEAAVRNALEEAGVNVAATTVPTPTPRPTTTTAGVEPATPATPAAPTTTVEPTDPTLPMRAPKPTPRDAPPYQRTGFGQVAATGIDVMTSTLGLPGVGAQLASLLFSGKSIGENLIDFAATHENYYQPGEGTGDPDHGDPERLTADILADAAARKEAREKSTSTVTPTTETFEEKYLGDGIWRPTPEMKWDINSPKYSPKYMGLE